MLGTGKVYPASMGHFASPYAQALFNFLERARDDLGERVRILLRGSAVLTPSEGEGSLENHRCIRLGERTSFLKAFERRGYMHSTMDIEWAPDDWTAKLIYQARHGITRLMQKPMEAGPPEQPKISDVF